MIEKKADDLLNGETSDDFSICVWNHTEPSNMTAPHYHEHYEILYVCENSRTLIHGDNIYQLDKNHLALISPYVLHKSFSGKEFPQRKFLINFTPMFVSSINRSLPVDVLKQFDFSTPIINLSDTAADEVLRIMEEMWNLYRRERTLQMSQAQIQMYRLKLLLLLTFISENKSVETPESAPYGQIISYIRKNYMNKLSLQDIANEFFMSKYTVSRIFSNQIGINFPDYLAKIRIEKAKSILSNSNLNISQVSEVTGFQSTTDFARVFKNLTGCSPTKYRKQCLREKNQDSDE